MTSTHNGDFYCLNCVHSFRTKKKLECHEKVCKVMIFVKLLCQLKKKKDILKFNQYTKSDKTPCIVYTDLESLIKNR